MGGEGGVLELEIAVFFEGGDGTRGGDQDGSERGFNQWWGERGGGVKCDQEMGGGVKIGLKKKLVFYSTHN